MAVKYNNYSSELLAKMPKADAAHRLQFRILGIRHDSIMKKAIIPVSSTFNAIDRIWDPWAKPLGDDKFEGDYIDIAYVIGERPTAPDAVRESQVQIGEIVFRREQLGAIEYAGERDLEPMARFLFFSNLNAANFDQPWYIKPATGHIWELLKSDVISRGKLTAAKLIDRAKGVIDDFSETRLMELAKGLFPNDYQNKTPEEIQLKMRSIAEKNPEKILNLSTDVDVKMNLFVANCVEKGLIEYNPAQGWVWSDDQRTICVVKPQQTKDSAIKLFFLTTAGIETLQVLEDLIDKPDKKEDEPVKKKPGFQKKEQPV